MVTDCLREASQQRRLVRVRCSQRGNALCEHHLTSLPPRHVAQVREELHRSVAVARADVSCRRVRRPDARLMFTLRQVGQVSLTGRPLFAFTLRA